MTFRWHLLTVIAMTATACSGWTVTDDSIVAEMSNSVGTLHHVNLRGRLVEQEEDFNADAATPLSDLSEDEVDYAVVDLRILDDSQMVVAEVDGARCDEEGYLDLQVGLQGLGAGRYTVEVLHDGHRAGIAGLHLLDGETSPVVVRSDIDLTYLDTHFASATELWELLNAGASARSTLPAMELVYDALRRGPDGIQDRSLVFLSGSPRFFRRVLSQKMQRDGVVEDGIVLKPFKEIVKRHLSPLAVGELIPSLKAQVGYKLAWLLRLRLEVPASAQEVLLGDDSEADFVTYALYARVLKGELSLDALGVALEEVGVSDGDRAYIADLALRARAVVSTPTPVRAIYINRTGRPSERFDVSAWLVPGVTLLHDGALPLIEDLARRGLVTPQAVDAVRRRLNPVEAPVTR